MEGLLLSPKPTDVKTIMTYFEAKIPNHLAKKSANKLKEKLILLKSTYPILKDVNLSEHVNSLLEQT